MTSCTSQQAAAAAQPGRRCCPRWGTLPSGESIRRLKAAAVRKGINLAPTTGIAAMFVVRCAMLGVPPIVERWAATSAEASSSSSVAATTAAHADSRRKTSAGAPRDGRNDLHGARCLPPAASPARDAPPLLHTSCGGGQCLNLGAVEAHGAAGAAPGLQAPVLVCAW